MAKIPTLVPVSRVGRTLAKGMRTLEICFKFHLEDGETNLDFNLEKILLQCLYHSVRKGFLFRDETCLTPAVCMMWWAVDPGFSTYPWNRWEQIIVTLHVSISKEDIIAFQLLEFIATYNLRPCYSIVKAGNNVHTQKSRNTIDFILNTFCAFTKIVWRISPRTVKGFPVLLAP
jgi:hypothetical protein